MVDQLVLPDVVHQTLYKRQPLQKLWPRQTSHLHGFAGQYQPVHNVMLLKGRHHRHCDIQISPVYSEYLHFRRRLIELPVFWN